MKEKQVCSKCVLDSEDDPKIKFDKDGVCTYCHIYDKNILKYYFGADTERTKFNNLINEIKQNGQGKKYDVLIGLSGGVDSTYVAFLCYKYKIRAIAVHLDNGWNSELSVVNIKNILKVTGYDLYTYVINWNEFKDLQRSYFKADVVDIEVLTDHAISSIMQKTAIKYKIKYILSGSSITTEGILPESWVFSKRDHINIISIQRKFGTKRIKSFPINGFLRGIVKNKIYKIKNIDFLNYIKYDKEEAKQIIKDVFKWRDYGGKHYESVFTRFYQAYILPEKFHIDKRKSHYSTLICAEQLNREQALQLLNEPLYSSELLKNYDKEYVLKKLEFEPGEFDEYINRNRVEHISYNSVTKYLLFLSKIKRKFLFWKYITL